MAENQNINRELKKRRQIMNIITNNYNDVEASSIEPIIPPVSLPDAGNSPKPFPHTEEQNDNYHL